MKTRYILLSAAALVFAACENPSEPLSKEGTLSFDACTLSMDDELITKATSAADGSFCIIIRDASGTEQLNTTYADIKSNGNSVSLPAGEYSLEARSSSYDVPAAAFEQPVYRAIKDFTITAGKTTDVGNITCTLAQCKVSVGYTDEFLSMVTGDGATTVTVTAGNPLEFALKHSGSSNSYESRSGYFAVNNGSNTTMEISYKGSIEGKIQRMTRTFTGIQERQWRHITFTKKLDIEGNATFDIVINDFVSDEDLSNSIPTTETIIGSDPSAPVGDGGISLESTCSYDITAPIAVPSLSQSFVLTMRATIPNRVKKFEVEIRTTSETFASSVASINDGQTVLDLVNPSAGAQQVFSSILPFPYGNDVYDKDVIDFDLSDAQEPLLAFPGDHTFIMKVTDQQGCKKEIPIVMTVK